MSTWSNDLVQSPAKRLKICHVITRMIVGGAQENTLLTCRGLIEKGHDVVLATGPTDGPEGRLLQKTPVPGLRVVEFPRLVREVRPRSDWTVYRELCKYFSENGFDVVHTHSSKAGILARLAAWKQHVPLVVHTIHGQAFHPYEQPWRNRLFISAERIAAARCHHIYAVAQAMIEQCVAAGVAPRAKYSVVYSGMDMQSFLEAAPDIRLRASLGIPDDALVVGKIARLFELKGHDFLIAAAQKIVKEFPNVCFLLVGDGVLKNSLQSEIKHHGLERNFIFTGLVSPDEIPRYAQLMDVLVHLSLREGLPRTVVQGLASGVPAVGFRLDGTPEIILDGETGYICEPADIEGVAQALARLLRDKSLRQRLGSRGRDFVKVQFDWHHMVESLEDSYFRLLKIERQESAH